MFAHARTYAVALTLGFVALALSTARPSQGASPESRHIVRPGETLWSIAAERYAGDPRAAVWRIERRNGLGGAPLRPGLVLYLPR